MKEVMNEDITIKVNDIIERYPKEESSLIQVLQDINDAYNYLPGEAMKIVAKVLKMPPSHLFSVATFYKAFSLKPRGKQIVKICKGTACHVRGAELIQDEFERELKIKAGETTEDLTFTLETVNCVGACGMAPVVIVDDVYFKNVNVGQAKKLMEKKNEI